MNPNRCSTTSKPSVASRLAGCLSLIVLLYGNSAAAQENERDKGPSVAETNRLIELGDAYRRLIASTLKWKAPPSAVCAAARVQIGTFTEEQGLIDPTTFNGNELALINAQQQAEENDLRRLAQLSRLVYEAVRLDCLILPPPSRR